MELQRNDVVRVIEVWQAHTSFDMTTLSSGVDSGGKISRFTDSRLSRERKHIDKNKHMVYNVNQMFVTYI